MLKKQLRHVTLKPRIHRYTKRTTPVALPITTHCTPPTTCYHNRITSHRSTTILHHHRYYNTTLNSPILHKSSFINVASILTITSPVLMLSLSDPPRITKGLIVTCHSKYIRPFHF